MTLTSNQSGRALAAVLLLLQAALPSGLAAATGEAAPAPLLPETIVPPLDPGEKAPGGLATSRHPIDRNAFSHSSANLPFDREFNFKIGNGVFRKQWVSAPSSTTASDGLGPLFNARACQNCHLKDGRGRPPVPGIADDRAVSMLVRLGIPGKDKDGKPVMFPDPHYGTQLQEFAIQGHVPEGRVSINYEDLPPITLNGGEQVRLRKPRIAVSSLGYGPMVEGVVLAPRVANQMIGLGLLEAVSEADILAGPEQPAARAEGIVGRPNRVWSKALQSEALGRFGWKAGQATIADQSATAFSNDMGLSTPIIPRHSGDCTESQKTCLDAPDGAGNTPDAVEVPAKMFDLVVFYARNLAVPAQRKSDELALGRELFYRTGCAACHRPSFTTPRSGVSEPELAEQTIWPFTDMLLHDMGPELADGFSDGLAGPQDWRTAPLWGIGLTNVVSGHTNLLHDGRARNVLEAILWHGGEGETARQRVMALTPSDRDALLAYVNSL